jgi:hypothetical protein
LGGFVALAKSLSTYLKSTLPPLLIIRSVLASNDRVASSARFGSTPITRQKGETV